MSYAPLYTNLTLEKIGDLRTVFEGMEEAQRIADRSAVKALEIINDLLEDEDDLEAHSAFYGYLRKAMRDAEKTTSATGKALSKALALIDSAQKARSEYFFLRGFEEG
jgi:hypothetical protein